MNTTPLLTDNDVRMINTAINCRGLIVAGPSVTAFCVANGLTAPVRMDRYIAEYSRLTKGKKNYFVDAKVSRKAMTTVNDA